MGGVQQLKGSLKIFFTSCTISRSLDLDAGIKTMVEAHGSLVTQAGRRDQARACHLTATSFHTETSLHHTFDQTLRYFV